jgi:predicted nucleic acid-binding protein
MGERIFVDANVLFSRTLRDWLFLLKLRSGGIMFTLGSTEDVLAETIAKLRDKRPDVSGKTITDLRAKLIDNLDELVDDFAVEPWMSEGDVGDAHVRAAAHSGGFDMLLTADGGLLAERETESPALYETINPDEFFVLIDDSNPGLVRRVVKEELEYFVNLNGDVDLPGRLRAAGCPEFATRVNLHSHAALGGS